MTIAPSLEFYVHLVRRTHIWGRINLFKFFSGRKGF